MRILQMRSIDPATQALMQDLLKHVKDTDTHGLWNIEHEPTKHEAKITAKGQVAFSLHCTSHFVVAAFKPDILESCLIPAVKKETDKPDNSREIGVCFNQEVHVVRVIEKDGLWMYYLANRTCTDWGKNMMRTLMGLAQGYVLNTLAGAKVLLDAHHKYKHTVMAQNPRPAKRHCP